MHGVVGAGLVGDGIGAHAAFDQPGQVFGGVAEQCDRFVFAGLGVPVDAGERVVEVGGLFVDVTGLQAHVDALLLAFDVEAAGAGKACGKRLRALHAAEAGGVDPLALEAAAVMLATPLDIGLVGALHDALAADVVPAAGGPLA